VESPITGRYIDLRFDPDQVRHVLADVSADAFTLEPYGTVRRCDTGESVSLRLEYEIGRAE